jgi:uncharacterized membrane protein YqjE
VSATSRPTYSTGVRTVPDDLATEPKRSDESLGDLLSEMTSELSTLFRKEIELAKTEAVEQATTIGKASAMFGGAALAAWLALVLLSLALAWLLDDVLNRALAFAIVGAVWAIAAFVLQRSGRAKLSALRGLPQTTQTIKEDLQWAKAQKS